MKAAFRWLWLPFKDATTTAISARGRQQVLSTPLYANSVYLMATSAASAALGFVFWVVAARLYAAEAIGLGSALLSAAALVSYVASLGLGMGLIRFLPDARGSVVALINSCFTITGFVALILAAIFLAGLPLWSPAMSFIWDNPGFAVAFVIFVTASSLYGLLSEVFVALRRAEFLLVQGILFGLLKLGLVVVLAGLFEAFGIFASWGLAATATLGLGLLLFLPRLLPAYRPVPTLRRQMANEMVRFSFANYLGTGLWSVPAWLLPLLVVNMLGSEVNAYFYISWAMASLLFAIPLSAATSLFAEGSHQEGYLARDALRSLKLILVLLLPAIAVMVVAGDKLLLLFGKEYSLNGAKLLWVLALSAIPFSVNTLYLGIARVRKRLRDIILVAVAMTTGTLGLSYFLIPHLGISGPGAGWLVSQSVVAIVVLPRVIRVLRTAPDAGSQGERAKG